MLFFNRVEMARLNAFVTKAGKFISYICRFTYSDNLSNFVIYEKDKFLDGGINIFILHFWVLFY